MPELQTISQSELREALIYDPDTGHWFRRRSSKACKAGKRLPIPERGKYHRIRINRVGYRAHRLAWLYMTGEWPTEQVDHINGEPSDNRWSNLRLANPIENARNSRIRDDNTSGSPGVARYKNGWRAYICGKHLGCFRTWEEAVACYHGASTVLFGEFKRSHANLREIRGV